MVLDGVGRESCRRLGGCGERMWVMRKGVWMLIDPLGVKVV
jgi:hypothetical protein